MIVAILDLGTNLFHLLIAKKEQNNIEVIHQSDEVVLLGEGGINDHYIQPISYQRGLDVLRKFHTLMQEFQVEKHVALATAAIRTASNGHLFIAEAKKQYDINIEAITGDQEAAYIYAGVVPTISTIDQNILVMDIGGGSVELILGNQNHIYWKKSFPIGAARLNELYHHSDPISTEELHKLSQYLMYQLNPLKEALVTHPSTILIGAAGAFQSLLTMLNIAIVPGKATSLSMAQFEQLYTQILFSDAAKRTLMPGIPIYRISMVVMAMELMKTVIEIQSTSKFLISPNSLQEGVLYCI